jgi:hypothetical protein
VCNFVSKACRSIIDDVKKLDDIQVSILVPLIQIPKRTTTGRLTNSLNFPAELVAYLENTLGPVPLVLDLRIAHDRFGSSSDPSLNGHLHPTAVSFMSVVASTSDRLHSDS